MKTESTVARTVHVVAHTHWDREWYLPFQQFRINLVRLMDQLLDIMRDEDYKHFLLDGQTIVLEDYLEIRPGQKSSLVELVQSGRVSIGPWYVLPDLFLVSGESIVRNLQLGRRVAEKFGEPMPVGYMPDQFGFITQMPQILSGFGIKNAVVWRGFDSGLPTEVWWESPDGSKVLAHKLEGKFGYFNAAHLTDAESPEKLRDQFTEIIERLTPLAATSHFLLMNGVDHRFPNAKLKKLVESLNEACDGTTIEQSSLPRYFQAVRQQIAEVPVVCGEQRKSEKMEMLQGTLSTRMYLKQENERTETLLAHQAEPLCAFSWLFGDDYPRELFLCAWRELIKNHAHDSICGCSLDEVHREMMTRFASARQIASMLSEFATKRIADALSGSCETPKSPHLMVFNTLPWERTELVDVEVRLPRDEEWGSFALFDGECDVPYTVIEEDAEFVTFDAGGSLDSFPVFDFCRKYVVRLLVENVPGWGYKALEVRPCAGAETKRSRITDFTADNGLPGSETEYIRLSFNPNGTFDILDLRSGLNYTGLNCFEDAGDCGDEYNYCPPDTDCIVTSSECRALISLEAECREFRTYRIEYELAAPSRLIRSEKSRRSDEQSRLKIVSHVTLTVGVPRVDVVTVVENNLRDHRLRVMFPTDVDTDTSFSETAFDVVERSIAPFDAEGWMEDPLPTRPQLAFASACSPNRSLAIANRGLTEYELCADDRRTFALTLLRCVEWGSRGDLSNTRRGHREDGSKGYSYMFTPEAQCQGTHLFRYSIIPCVGDVTAGQAVRQAYNHKVEMIVYQRRLSPAAAKSGTFISATISNSVVPGALKVANCEDMLVARLVNLSTDATKLELVLDRDIESADVLGLDEQPLTDATVMTDRRSVVAELLPKVITTVGMRTASRQRSDGL